MCESLIQKHHQHYFFFQKRTSNEVSDKLINEAVHTHIQFARQRVLGLVFQSCKNGQLFFVPFSKSCQGNCFSQQRKALILLCCCALALLEMRGYRAAATFNNGERIQSEVNGACIEPIHLFSRGLTKVSKYLSPSDSMEFRAYEEHHVKRDLNPLDTSVSLLLPGKLIRGMHHSKNPSVSSS